MRHEPANRRRRRRRRPCRPRCSNGANDSLEIDQAHHDSWRRLRPRAGAEYSRRGDSRGQADPRQGQAVVPQHPLDRPRREAENFRAALAGIHYEPRPWRRRTMLGIRHRHSRFAADPRTDAAPRLRRPDRQRLIVQPRQVDNLVPKTTQWAIWALVRRHWDLTLFLQGIHVAARGLIRRPPIPSC